MIATHQVPQGRIEALRADGVPTPAVYEIDPAEAGAFREQIAALRDGNKYAASVYVYEEEEYRNMRMFLTDDGNAGFALNGDDIISVFSRKDGAHSGCAPALLATAVEQGGRRLDCFDTVLPDIYAPEGFEVVSRLRWNDEHAPADWDKETFHRYNGGEPDVVLMAYRPERIGTPYIPGEGSYCDDWDTAAEKQQRAVREWNTQ